MTVSADHRAGRLNSAVVQEIHVALARKDWGQVQLANELGENEAWVSRRLSRRARSSRSGLPLTLADVERIAEALGIDPFDLLPRSFINQYGVLTDHPTGHVHHHEHTRPSGPDARPPTQHGSSRPPAAVRPAALLRSGALSR